MNDRAIPGTQMAWISQDAEVLPPHGWRLCSTGSTRLARARGESGGRVSAVPGVGIGAGWGGGEGLDLGRRSEGW